MYEVHGLMSRGNKEYYKDYFPQLVTSSILWFAMDRYKNFQYIDGSTRWGSHFFWERMFVKWKFGCSDELYYYTPFEPINTDNVIRIPQTTKPIYVRLNDKILKNNTCTSYLLRRSNSKMLNKFETSPNNIYGRSKLFRINWMARLTKEDEEKFIANSLPFEYKTDFYFDHLDKTYQKSVQQISQLLKFGIH